MTRDAADGITHYWLDLFSARTWQEFLKAGADVSGFRERQWHSVERIRVGDVLLCYLTGVSRLVGALEVTRPAFRDSTPIWGEEVFPCRVGVKAMITLTPATGVPILELRDRLSIFNPDHPNAWTGRVRGSPSRWSAADGQAVMLALTQAGENPVQRPIDPLKMERRPRALRASKIKADVTIPDRQEESTEPGPELREPSDHTEVQWLLLKLGSDIGFEVWAARSDRSRDWKGHRFSDLPKFRQHLPRQFDEATNRTIEQIDVLWLQASSIVAAFEIENTTSVYSGLLRMSDLVAMQPNLSIPLYIVAPDERRGKVFSEINRPTFTRLAPPLSQTCRFIAFSSLRNWITQYASIIAYLRPDFLLELSESCEPEEA